MLNALKNKDKQWYKAYYTEKGASNTNRKFLTYERVSEETITYSETLSNLRGKSYGLAIRTNYNHGYEELAMIDAAGKDRTIIAVKQVLLDLNTPSNRMINPVYDKNQYWVILLS